MEIGFIIINIVQLGSRSGLRTYYHFLVLFQSAHTPTTTAPANIYFQALGFRLRRYCSRCFTSGPQFSRCTSRKMSLAPF